MKDRQKHRIPWMAVLLLAIAYPLSFGPAHWLTDNGWIHDGTAASRLCNFVYAPLIYCNIPLLEDLLDWYVDLWL